MSLHQCIGLIGLVLMVGGDRMILFPMMKDGCGWIETMTFMRARPALSIEKNNESI